VLCQVVASVGPRCKALAAETTPASYAGCFGLPAFHLWNQPAAMDESQVLRQMIFPIKSATGYRFFTTFAMVV
jgi:hypothetical protein